ncbi:MAG: hypothetical protein AAFQ66_11810 [Pseudomonadota bacterium]
MGRILFAIFLAAMATHAQAQEEPSTDAPAEAPVVEPPMDLARMADILQALDPEVQARGTAFQLTIGDVPIVIITDPVADRMRAMVPIRDASAMTSEELMRVMQANFDTALDARYAIAQGRLWSTFIHPLSPLKKDQLISGLGQTVNVATSYGTLYSGGALSYGGGDSGEIQRKLIDDLLDKGKEI